MTRVVLDIGTTRIRAARVSGQGELVGPQEALAPPLIRRGLRVEQDLAGVVQCVGHVLAALHVSGPVELGVTCQRGTTVMLDGRGRPVGRLVSWQDRREGGLPTWMSEHRPAPWARVVRTMSLAAWLAVQWTGRAVEHPATQTPWPVGVPVDLADGPVSFGARAPFEAGRVWWVGGDKNCELFGAGAVAPGRWAVSAGTALSMGSLVESSQATAPGTFRTPSPVAGLDTVEVGLPVGGSVRHHMPEPMPEDLVLPAVDGPLCIPYFGGSLRNPGATAVWVGDVPLLSDAERWALVVEGFVLELMRASRALPERRGELGLCGGFATPLFAQWISNAFTAEVHRWSNPWIGLVGAGQILDWVSSGGIPFSIFHPLASARWAKRLTIFEEALRMQSKEHP